MYDGNLIRCQIGCVSLCADACADADAGKIAHGRLSRSASLFVDACAEGNCPHSDRSM